MSQNSVLVLGRSGQVAQALTAAYPEAIFLGRNECDLSNPESLRSLPWETYDVVINAAAYTAVDAAETPEGKRLAQLINADAPQVIAECAQESGTTVVHISSDYVFDGKKVGAYSETDVMNPLGVYAQTKAAGDVAIAAWQKHYILRTSWVIGDGNNFVRTMERLAKSGVNPEVVDDQFGRLTFTQDIAQAVKHLIDTHAPYGTYNVTNEGEVASWADIAKVVFSQTGQDPARVTGVSTEKYFSDKPGLAPRPLNSVLDLAKIESTGLIPEIWRKRLAQYLS